MENSAEYLKVNIKFYRLAKKMSQETLAEKSDISVHFAKDLELGRKKPSIETLDKLANALDIKTFQLLMNPEATHHKVIKDYATQLKEKLNFEIDNLAEKF